MSTTYRNAYKETLHDAEPEIVEPPKDTDPVTGEEITNQEPTHPEEITFKKRYGDLRRFMQDKENGYKKNINELQARVDAASRQSVQLPKSEEEIDAWAKEFPDVAKIVETIAMKKVNELRQDVDKGFNEVAQAKLDNAKERAANELIRLHPDFEDIRADEKFHAWVDGQPDWVQKALYENETDARSAARAIDLYKLDNPVKKPVGRPRKDAGAAEEVPSSRRSAPSENDDTGNKVKESWVASLKPRDYDKHEDEIMAARREGRFIYDLSGRAM